MPQTNLVTALFEKKGFKKYFFNTGWLMMNNVVRLVMGLLVGLLVARYLEPERYGLYNFAISFVALFGAFGNLGLDWIVTRNAVEHPEQRNQLLGTAFVLRVIGGFVVAALALGAIQFTGSDRLTVILVAIIAIGPVFQSFTIIEQYFQAQVKGRLAAISNMASLTVLSIIKIVLVWCQASLIWFVWAIVLYRLTTGALLCFMYVKQHGSLLEWRFRCTKAKSMLKDSWPLMVSGMMIMVIMRVDQVMLKVMLGNEAVGIYVPAVKLSEIWYFLPAVISKSIFPAILNAKGDDSLYYARLQGLFSMLIWMAVALAIPISILSEPIVSLLYGANYKGSGAILAIYVWAGIPVFFGAAWGKWILSENHQKIVLLTNGFSMVINVILNVILIPRIGAAGAAWATVIAASASQVAGLLTYRRHISLRMLYRSLWVTTLISQARAIFRR
jgi:O-antigen/teichoic acid export membrane protein